MDFRHLAASAILSGLTVMCPGWAEAHGRHQTAQPLAAVEVAAVIDSLTVLAASAVGDRSVLNDVEASSLIAAVYAYAARTDRLAALPEGTETVLVISEALSDGVVTPDGAFTNSLDAFQWFGLINAADVQVVAAHSDTLARFRSIFLKGGS